MSLAEDSLWRYEYRHHPGLGRVGISQGEGDRIALALETTLSNIRNLIVPVNGGLQATRATATAKR